MTGTIRIHQVAGKQYKVWADFIKRSEYAEDEYGTVKKIFGGGYITKDLTVRKAIAAAFKLPTFRK